MGSTLMVRCASYLIEAIPAVARRAELVSPCRALLIGYCGEDLLGTYPGFFLVSRRGRSPSSSSKRICEIEGEGERTLDQLAEPLRAAAWRLNAIDWSAVMPITDDFVVVARDNTGEIDLERDREASVPPARRGRLRLDAPRRMTRWCSFRTARRRSAR